MGLAPGSYMSVHRFTVLCGFTVSAITYCGINFSVRYTYSVDNTVTWPFWKLSGLNHSTSFNMASTNKKRKSSDCYRIFNKQWTNSYFFVAIDDKPVCLICHESVSISKKFNIQRHYDRKHASTFDQLQGQLRVDEVNRLRDYLKRLYIFESLNEDSVENVKLGESKTGHSSSQDVSYACEFVDEENTRGSYDYEYDESEFVSDDPLVAEGSGDGGVDADQKLNPPLILPQAKKKCDRKIDIGLINDAILRLDKVTAKTERMNCGLDDFEAFGRYVVTSLRRMDADGASEAQREMQRIVEDALKEIAAVEDVDDEQRLASRSIEESLNESETSTANVTLDRARVDEDDAVMQNDSEETPRSTVAKRKPNEYISIDETQEKDDEVEVSAAEKSGESVIMSAPPLAVKRKRLTSQSEMISHVIDKVDYMMNKVKCDTDPDNFELLGRYVSASLRKMPMQLALRVENDLYSIVIKHKLDSMRKCSKVSYNL